MSNKSKIILHALRLNRKQMRRELYMRRQLGRAINGVPPSDFELNYSKELSLKTHRREWFILLITGGYKRAEIN